MKKLFCILVFLLLPLSLQAKDQTVEIVGSDACKLFDALAVKQNQIPNDVHGYSLYQKTVSGLSCTFWINTWQTNSGCGCIFDANPRTEQMAEIYHTVYVYETTIDEGNPKIYMKEVGGLQFTRLMYQEGHEFHAYYEFPFLMEE